MEETTQQIGSPELLPKEKKSKLPLVLAIILLLLVGAYAGLCVWVSASGLILPNVQVGDTVVGGMTVDAAAQAIKADADAKFSPHQAEIAFDKTGANVLFVAGDYITADGQAAALDAYSVGRSDSPALYGFNFFKALTKSTYLELPIIYDPDAPDIYTTLDNAFRGHEQPVVQSTYTVGETEIQIQKGITGLRYDREEAARIIMQNIVDAANYGRTPRTSIEPIRTEPTPSHWEAVADSLYVAPVDTAIDPETKEVFPSVTGVSLNVYDAQALYAQAAEGDTFTVPLTFTEPAFTTDMLFRDNLGEVKTWISGVQNRLTNVTMAAAACNDVILLPGDVFSYWETGGPFSAAQGYLPAPSYVNGETVDSVAGGVCQVSSSIYYASLKANMEIVERRNHTYAVGYVPDGADATVFSGNPDFRFKNNTEYPIRIVAVTNGRNMTVRLEGTKVEDTYVNMEFVELSRTPYKIVYKADATVPPGTTVESVTPYIGRKVEAYRCIYAGDGTLLSKTLESVSNYKARDQVFLCSPAELYLYDPTVPAPTPSVVPSPEPIPAPALPAEELPLPAPAESPVPTEEIPQ